MRQEKKTGNVAVKALIVIALVTVTGIVIFAKNANRNNGRNDKHGGNAQTVSTNRFSNPTSKSGGVKHNEGTPIDAGKPIPKLVDLGAGKCIPCKMMAPILEELKGEYKGRFDVVFIDVWKNESAGDQYGIRVIPTQIFFDADGKELFRHEGFFSKEDILAKWKEMGVEFVN